MKRMGCLNLIICFMLLTALSCKKTPKKPTLHDYVQKIAGTHYWHGTVREVLQPKDSSYAVLDTFTLIPIGDSIIVIDHINHTGSYYDTNYFDGWDKEKKDIYFINNISIKHTGVIYHTGTESMNCHYSFGSNGYLISADLSTP